MTHPGHFSLKGHLVVLITLLQMLRSFILSKNEKCHYRFLWPAEVSTFMLLFSLFIPARQTPGMNIPALTLLKQPRHFLVLPQKCANHPGAETETFLSRPQPNQNQKLSVWEPFLEYLCLNVCIFQEVELTVCELRRLLKWAVNFFGSRFDSECSASWNLIQPLKVHLWLWNWVPPRGLLFT